MLSRNITYALDAFSSRALVFSPRDVLDWTGTRADLATLTNIMMADRRFVQVGAIEGAEAFLPAKRLFRWYSALTLRLAAARDAWARGPQLALAISRLRPEGRWTSPPAEAVRWAEDLGFVGPSATPGAYVFPLARVLGATRSGCMYLARDVLEHFAKNELWAAPLLELAEKFNQEGLARFRPRVVDIVLARHGLPSGPSMTLRQLGDQMGVSRERARQIQDVFWHRLDHKRAEYLWPFLAALVSDVMGRHGSLIFSADAPEGPKRAFLAKCLGLSVTNLAPLGLTLLAHPEMQAVSLWSLRLNSDELDEDSIAARLESKYHSALVEADIRLLARRLAESRPKTQTLGGKVAAALRVIGKPAHYSAVTETYNRLFPDTISTQRNVHATLGRERHGVVRTETRGVFALAEWGYHRSSGSPPLPVTR